jgi:hypothetical protein
VLQVRASWIAAHCTCAAVSAAIFVVAADAATPPSAPGTAGGAQDTLSIRQVKLVFGLNDRGATRMTVKPGEPIPAFAATLFYSGAGTLKGRWEVAQPGDELPTAAQTVPDYARRPGEPAGSYKMIDSFFDHLPATGRASIAGPPPDRLPRDRPGTHTILFRIESIASIKMNNPPQPGLVLPVLQYTVIGSEQKQ